MGDLVKEAPEGARRAALQRMFRLVRNSSLSCWCVCCLGLLGLVEILRDDLGLFAGSAAVLALLMNTS